MNQFVIRPARFPAEHAAVRTLLDEYEASIGLDLCFQDFAVETANLPGDYAPPAGRFLVAAHGDYLAGCVALRPVEGRGEMKRLFVRPQYRNSGLGKMLTERIIAEAKLAGYSEIILDTLPTMTEAIALYHKLGFVAIPQYREYSTCDVMYFGKPL